MSAYTEIAQIWFVARAVDEREDEFDPVSKLAILEALGIALRRMLPNVAEFSMAAADQKADDVQRMIAAARKAIPEDAWAAAMGQAMTAGPSKERIAELTVLFT